MATKKPTVTIPGKRAAPPEAAVRALEASAEARQGRPAGEPTASLQARPTAPRQAVTTAPEAAQGDEGDRSVRRKRGAWTKAEPYTRKDGTETRGTTVYMPVELAERLRRLAFERDEKQNAIIVAAIADYLERAGA